MEKETQVDKDVQKYRTDILEFIKDIDGLEKEINDKDKDQGLDIESY